MSGADPKVLHGLSHVTLKTMSNSRSLNYSHPSAAETGIPRAGRLAQAQGLEIHGLPKLTLSHNKPETPSKIKAVMLKQL